MTERLSRTRGTSARLFLLAGLMLASAPSAATIDPSEWYGSRIGDPALAGVREQSPLDGSNIPTPAPWRYARGETDSTGRLAALRFYDPCCVLATDTLPGYIPRRYRSVDQISADGEAVKAYAIARLGKPDKVYASGKGSDRSFHLSWDFVAYFQRCDGIKPVYESLSHEPSGKIASASLDFGPEGVDLEISGYNTNAGVTEMGNDDAVAVGTPPKTRLGQPPIDQQRRLDDEQRCQYEADPNKDPFDGEVRNTEAT